MRNDRGRSGQPHEERSIFTGRRISSTGPGRTEPLLRRGENPAARPTWRQSEIDDVQRLRRAGNVVESQVSFKNGVRCRNGTPDSIRVDSVVGNSVAHEMKNYNLTTNSNGLVRDIVEQARSHQPHLPEGMKQVFKIDVRGQAVSPRLRNQIAERIVTRSEGILSLDDIIYVGENL